MSRKSEEVVDVRWAELESAGGMYRRECPYCDGVLLVGRDKDTLMLQEYDRCIQCGQRVRYLDIEEMRALERA
ncbi:unnamed protein product [marine sediment metagenome]|uniref:Uncharacterized protein n=1 Tax=marine sediment metagenome TaxID=412755 RepID=X1P1N9_9ZZZZ